MSFEGLSIQLIFLKIQVLVTYYPCSSGLLPALALVATCVDALFFDCPLESL